MFFCVVVSVHLRSRKALRRVVGDAPVFGMHYSLARPGVVTLGDKVIVVILILVDVIILNEDLIIYLIFILAFVIVIVVLVILASVITIVIDQFSGQCKQNSRESCQTYRLTRIMGKEKNPWNGATPRDTRPAEAQELIPSFPLYSKYCPRIF